MDPLHQFLIKPLIPIQLGGLDLSFTNSSLAMIIATFVIILICDFGTQKKLLVPSRLQSFAEVAFDFINATVLENIGEEGRKYFPFIFSIALFIFFGNFLGMIPYAFTFTSHIIVTFAMAVSIYSLVMYLSLSKFGWGFFKRFVPQGVPWPIIPILVPVEIISYFFRPISLSVRLFANMMAGHILLKIIAGFCILLGLKGILLPLIFNTVFIGFEFFVAGLQAYIFTILSCVYIQDALHSH